jgi:hypothetical protein
MSTDRQDPQPLSPEQHLTVTQILVACTLGQRNEPTLRTDAVGTFTRGLKTLGEKFAELGAVLKKVGTEISTEIEGARRSQEAAARRAGTTPYRRSGVYPDGD